MFINVLYFYWLTLQFIDCKHDCRLIVLIFFDLFSSFFFPQHKVVGLLNSHPWVCCRLCWIWPFQTPPCHQNRCNFFFDYTPLNLWYPDFISRWQTKILFFHLKCHYSTHRQPFLTLKHEPRSFFQGASF